MGFSAEDTILQKNQISKQTVLHGPDGSWLLYPIREKKPFGKLFSEKKGITIEAKPRVKIGQQEYVQWLGNLVLVSFLVMVFFRLTYPRRFKQFFKALLSNKDLYQLLREWGPMNILSLVFSLMHTIGLAILIYVGSDVMGSPISFASNWVTDLIILSGITTFVVYGKYATILFLAWLFQLRDSGRRYLSNQILYSFLFSLVLFPVLLSNIYNPSPQALLISGILIALIHLIRLLRSFAIGLTESQIPLVYLILYLCTLEIVPLVLLFKAINVVISGYNFA